MILALKILSIWFEVSIVVALVVGPALARRFGEE
jgi:uncharacterized membrane protein